MIFNAILCYEIYLMGGSGGEAPRKKIDAWLVKMIFFNEMTPYGMSKSRINPPYLRGVI